MCHSRLVIFQGGEGELCLSRLFLNYASFASFEQILQDNYWNTHLKFIDVSHLARPGGAKHIHCQSQDFRFPSVFVYCLTCLHWNDELSNSHTHAKNVCTHGTVHVFLVSCLSSKHPSHVIFSLSLQTSKTVWALKCTVSLGKMFYYVYIISVITKFNFRPALQAHRNSSVSYWFCENALHWIIM